MATVTVRHLNSNDRREMDDIYSDNKRLEYATKIFKDNRYERVADLELGGSLGAILNESYYFTNSIESVWYENEDIQVAEGFEEGCRSTSIGDIIQIAGESYMVAGDGFKYMERG